MFQLIQIISVVGISTGLTKEKGLTMKEFGNGIAVVELFTSEGCSSCPPADRLLSKIAAENKNVFVLSYHVDYWDYLGWKDQFSQSIFTDRQRQYAQHFKLKSIYTPQVVINGEQEFVGSDEQRLKSSLSRYTVLASVDVNVVRKNAISIDVMYKLNITEPLQLHVALIQPNAVTEIKRGENSGRTLHHANIVLHLTTHDVKSANGKMEIEVPDSLKDKEIVLLLFTQHEKDNRITAATKVMLPRFIEIKNNK